MATTASAVLLGTSSACVAHVGDSRVYVLRDGTLAQITARSLVGRGAGPRRHADARRRRASIPGATSSRARCPAATIRKSTSTEIDAAAGRALPALLRRPVRRRRRSSRSRRSLGDRTASLERDLRAAHRRGQRRRRARTTSPRWCCRSMLHNLAALLRYRGLIQSLVARELKARYRGSVLGFFWSFINPLLLLLVYSFVFTYILPSATPRASSTTRCSCSAASCRGRGSRRRCSSRRAC